MTEYIKQNVFPDLDRLIAKKEVLHAITRVPVSVWEVQNAVPGGSGTIKPRTFQCVKQCNKNNSASTFVGMCH